MFGASTFGTTVPNDEQVDTLPGRRPTAGSSSLTDQLAEVDGADDVGASVPARANGVRTPAMIATRRPFGRRADMRRET